MNPAELQADAVQVTLDATPSPNRWQKKVEVRNVTSVRLSVCDSEKNTDSRNYKDEERDLRKENLSWVLFEATDENSLK